MNLLTREEWAAYMVPKVEWGGRRWHNMRVTLDQGICVEDYIKGERVFIPAGDDSLTLNIPRDPRLWDWQYSCDFHPAYVAIGADKWKHPTLEEMGWTNPPPPIESVTTLKDSPLEKKAGAPENG